MKPFGSASRTFVFLIPLLCLSSVVVLGQVAKDNGHPSAAAASTQSANPPSTPDQGYGNGKDSQSAGKGMKEDWTNLKVPPDFKFSDPMGPLRSEHAEYTREFVQLAWRPWDIINVYIVKPAGVKKPPVILYMYSFPKTVDGFTDDNFDKLVTKNGFAAVAFVSALTGQRIHDRPTNEWFVSELQEALGSSVHDVQLMLNYLEKRGDLDTSRVGMFADGSAASIAILAASVDPRIRALDLLNPWGDWPDWLAKSSLIKIEDERTTFLKPEFLKKVEGMDPVNYLPQLKTQQVRVQYLDIDTVTPKVARERMEAAAPPNAVSVHYPDAVALIKKVGTTEKLLDWIQEQVVSPAPPQGPVAEQGAKDVAPAQTPTANASDH